MLVIAMINIKSSILNIALHQRIQCRLYWYQTKIDVHGHYE